MNNKGNTSRTKFTLLSLILLVTGCAASGDLAMPPIQYENIDKVNLKVALYLSEELRDAKSELTSGGATITINLGEAFLEKSKKLAHEIFSEVVVTKNDPNNELRSEVDAILIPKLISTARTRPLTMFETQKSMIVFEWTMKDANSSDIIWVETFTTEGEGPFVTNPSVWGQVGGAKIQFEEAFQALYRDSFNTMSSSKAIKEFAASKK